jgi:hypothetical protein
VAAMSESPTSAEELSVGDYLQQWLAHVAGRVRPKTLDGYRGLIRLFYASPGLESLRLVELKPLDVQGLYSELPQAADWPDQTSSRIGGRRSANLINLTSR